MEFPFRSYNIVSVFSLCVYLCIPARCVFCPIFFEKKSVKSLAFRRKVVPLQPLSGTNLPVGFLRSGH